MPGCHKARTYLLLTVAPEVGHFWRQKGWPKSSSSLLEPRLEEGPLGPSGPTVCWWDFGGGRGGYSKWRLGPNCHPQPGSGNEGPDKYVSLRATWPASGGQVLRSSLLVKVATALETT